MSGFVGLRPSNVGQWHACCELCRYQSKGFPTQPRARAALVQHETANSHRLAVSKAASAR